MDINSIPILPSSWSNIQPDIVYITSKGRWVSFGKTQIELGQKYDAQNKHLKAIEKGEVSPKGNMGLVPSEKEGYNVKSKVLGKGGDSRFHGQYLEKIVQVEEEGIIQEKYYILLHFPGIRTKH